MSCVPKFQGKKKNKLSSKKRTPKKCIYLERYKPSKEFVNEFMYVTKKNVNAQTDHASKKDSNNQN